MLSIPFQISKKRLGKNDDNAKKKNWRPTPPHVDVDVETRQQRKKTKKISQPPPAQKKNRKKRKRRRGRLPTPDIKATLGAGVGLS